jgi:rifampicin phosphotransferase
MWIMDEIFPKPSTPSDTGDDRVHGIPGSPGRYTGRACILREESQFDQLQRGDVLVCPTTSPAWSVLFTRAGALVTDGGAVLSHAAVIAREYGIPAVLATGDATRRLHSGDIVTVDGVTGTVQLDRRT